MTIGVDSRTGVHERVLLVDDDDGYRDSLAKLLHGHGYCCDTASDAESAEQKLRQVAYGAVISDLRMPGNAKGEFVEQLCSTPGAPPLIVLTAYPSLDSAMRSANLHVSSYIEKPVTAGELLPHIERATDRSRARRAVADLEARLQAAGEATEHMRDLLEGGAGGATDRELVGSLRRTTARELLSGLVDLEDLREQLGGEPPAADGEDLVAPGVPLDQLSPREREVLQFIARGYRVPTISAQLDISRHTVRNHLKRIFAKLGVASQAELLELIKPVQPRR